MSDDFVCCSVIEFGDGGEPSVVFLARGDKEACDRVAELLSAISYSGDRSPITASFLVVAPAEHYAPVECHKVSL